MSAPGEEVVYRSRGKGGLAAAQAFVERVAKEEYSVASLDVVRAAASPHAAGFDPERDILLTAERDGRLVGVLMVRRDVANRETARFQWLTVDEPERNGGVGKELLTRGIEMCREQHVRVLRAWSFAASPAGPRLFWLHGFRVVDLVPVVFGSGTRESILFEKCLDPSPGPLSDSRAS